MDPMTTHAFPLDGWKGDRRAEKRRGEFVRRPRALGAKAEMGFCTVQPLCALCKSEVADC
jgi:hypothetical protein